MNYSVKSEENEIVEVYLDDLDEWIQGEKLVKLLITRFQVKKIAHYTGVDAQTWEMKLDSREFRILQLDTGFIFIELRASDLNYLLEKFIIGISVDDVNHLK